MRGFIAFGLLVASLTSLLNVFVPEDLSTTDAVVLMGMAACLILAGIAMGIYELITVTIRGL